ncbi:hypothetical protein GGX14DRAFT_355152, partial [Mycena pura]
EHVFVYDNATTHRKQADDALSARKMPKSTPVPYKSGKNAGKMRPNFLVKRIAKSTDGKPIYKPDGTLLKEKIPMTGATFADGHPQSLYFENGPQAGMFKGMESILIEHGYNVKGKRAECPNFNCAQAADGQHGDCCMRQEVSRSWIGPAINDTCSEGGPKYLVLLCAQTINQRPARTVSCACPIDHTAPKSHGIPAHWL